MISLQIPSAWLVLFKEFGPNDGCINIAIVSDKFDVLRGRLLGNHNDFHWQLGG